MGHAPSFAFGSLLLNFVAPNVDQGLALALEEPRKLFKESIASFGPLLLGQSAILTLQGRESEGAKGEIPLAVAQFKKCSTGSDSATLLASKPSASARCSFLAEDSSFSQAKLVDRL